MSYIEKLIIHFLKVHSISISFRNILVSFSITLCSEVSGQKANVDSIEFCNRQFALPEDCSAPHNNQAVCTDFYMFWAYSNKQLLDYLSNVFINSLKNQFENSRLDSLNIQLLGQKVKGVKLTSENKGDVSYIPVSYGTVNQQAVLVWFILEKNFDLTDDLPAYVRNFVSIVN